MREIKVFTVSSNLIFCFYVVSFDVERSMFDVGRSLITCESIAIKITKFTANVLKIESKHSDE